MGSNEDIAKLNLSPRVKDFLHRHASRFIDDEGLLALGRGYESWGYDPQKCDPPTFTLDLALMHYLGNRMCADIGIEANEENVMEYATSWLVYVVEQMEELPAQTASNAAPNFVAFLNSVERGAGSAALNGIAKRRIRAYNPLTLSSMMTLVALCVAAGVVYNTHVNFPHKQVQFSVSTSRYDERDHRVLTQTLLTIGERSDQEIAVLIAKMRNETSVPRQPDVIERDKEQVVFHALTSAVAFVVGAAVAFHFAPPAIVAGITGTASALTGLGTTGTMVGHGMVSVAMTVAPVMPWVLNVGAGSVVLYGANKFAPQYIRLHNELLMSDPGYTASFNSALSMFEAYSGTVPGLMEARMPDWLQVMLRNPMLLQHTYYMMIATISVDTIVKMGVRDHTVRFVPRAIQALANCGTMSGVALAMYLILNGFARQRSIIPLGEAGHGHVLFAKGMELLATGCVVFSRDASMWYLLTSPVIFNETYFIVSVNRINDYAQRAIVGREGRKAWDLSKFPPLERVVADAKFQTWKSLPPRDELKKRIKWMQQGDEKKNEYPMEDYDVPTVNWTFQFQPSDRKRTKRPFGFVRRYGTFFALEQQSTDRDSGGAYEKNASYCVIQFETDDEAKALVGDQRTTRDGLLDKLRGYPVVSTPAIADESKQTVDVRDVVGVCVGCVGARSVRIPVLHLRATATSRFATWEQVFQWVQKG